jgi:hypothetical protein
VVHAGENRSKIRVVKVLLARYSWFVAVGAFFFYRDSCLGGGSGDPPVPPQDAAQDAPQDAKHDARLDLGDPLARPIRPA